MTPLGARMRELRAAKGIPLKTMAKALGVSAAYLSALEHGHRGVPRSGFLELVNACLNNGWEEAEELRALASISDPKVTLNTGGLSPKATELANRLGAQIRELDDSRLDALLAELAEIEEGRGG